MNKAGQIMKKAMSGRFFLAVCVGITFAYCACTEVIEGKDTMLVVMVVARDYFSQNRKEETPE